MIIRRQLDPSNEDAERLTRSERNALLFFMNAVSVLEDMEKDLRNRLESIDNGQERMHNCSEMAAQILHELKLTVPMDQRKNLGNVATDYHMRLVPNSTPISNRNLVVDKENFRELVDSAQEKCRICVETDESCQRCKLFRILSTLLPMEEYHSNNLCPYNMAEWEN